MPDSLDELLELATLLKEDQHKAQQILMRSKSQFNRRLYIRTVFPCIEGITYKIKMFTLEISKILEVKLSKEEREKLAEKSIDRDYSGKVVTKNKYLSFPENIKFTFSVFAKATNATRKPNFNKGWKSLKKASETRNRITHPKQRSDLEISNEKMVEILDGAVWYFDSLEELFRGLRRRSNP